MEVSAVSNAKFVAFRQLVYSCSQQLSREEIHAIVYIRLYQERETYKEVPALTVLSKLETDGVFSSWKPEGLLDIVKDLKRHDLIVEVKDFLKKKWPKVVKKTTDKQLADNDDPDEDLHLKATFQVVIAQATVLMQQIEVFQRAINGVEHPRERAKEVIGLAAQTAQTLADRLFRAQTDLYPSTLTGSQHTVTAAPADGTRTTPLERHSSPSYSVPLEIPKPDKRKKRTRPIPALDLTLKKDEAEDDYEVMRSTVSSVKAIETWYRDNPQVDLASCYGAPLTGGKSTSTVGESSVTAFTSTTTLPTYRNMANVPSSSDSSATTSLTHSLETTLRGSSPTGRRSSDRETSLSPVASSGAVYCNISDLRQKLLPVSTKGAHVHSLPHTEAIYSNIASFNAVPAPAAYYNIPPRDIERKLPISFGAPESQTVSDSVQRLSGSLEEDTHMGEESRCKRENDFSSLPTKLPQDSPSETTTDSVTGQREAHAESAVHPAPQTRPLVAPKPKSRQKPEAPPRRSSLSRLARNKVIQNVPNRQTKCASVVATFKSSVQNDPDDNYMYLQPELDPSSCTDDSGFTDELELRVLRQIATKTGPLLEDSDSHYYKQLRKCDEQQDDPNKAYATVHHH